MSQIDSWCSSPPLIFGVGPPRWRDRPRSAGDEMLKRVLGVWVVAALVLSSAALAQSKPVQSREPVSSGRTLSAWIADLKAPAPQTRNAAAYEIAGMGPAAVAAVPALIE